MDKLSIKDLEQMHLSVSNTIINNREYLGEIDRKIGDGDHGEGMYLGFSSMKKMIEKNNHYKTVGEFYKEIGMSLLSSMGGASGVLFASIYISLAEATKDEINLSSESLVRGFEKALISIKERGGANLGDKTMIDALEPAVNQMKKAVANNKDMENILYYGKEGATQGVLDTKEMLPKRGRSKALGERSLGYQDAGATSVSIIFDTMWKYFQKQDEE